MPKNPVRWGHVASAMGRGKPKSQTGLQRFFGLTDDAHVKGVLAWHAGAAEVDAEGLKEPVRHRLLPGSDFDDAVRSDPDETGAAALEIGVDVQVAVVVH